MNKNKYTPAPWGVEQTEDTNWVGPLRADGKCHTIVCYTDREGLKDSAREINDANAHLIAAAPLLLEALEAMREAVKQEPAMNHAKYNQLGSMANYAILKATENSRPEAQQMEKLDQWVIDRILKAYPELKPSAGHDLLDELIGEIKVARLQRDDAEMAYNRLLKSLCPWANNK